MTPELLARVAAEPALVAGMGVPRFQQALAEMQKDPAGVLKKYAEDAALQHFLRTYMGVLGAHFEELGKAEDAARAAEAPSSSSSKGSAAPSSSGAGIGLVPAATKKLKDQASAGGLSPSGPPTAAVVAAAVSGELQVDEEVRAALSNAELVEVLRDPSIQGIMQECAADAGRFRHYLQVPEVRKKLLVMRKAGLVQF
jgi:hypothetical protein